MWKFGKKSDKAQIPNSVAVAIILAVTAFAVAAGVMRWSWLIMDEQIVLRKELNKLEVRQSQVETQYEFWLGQLQEERKMMK